MGDLLEKAKGFIIEKSSTLLPKNPSMTIIKGYALLLIISTLSYLIGWFFQWIVLGKLILGDLEKLIQLLYNPAFVACVSALALLLMDKNNNGYSDKLEEDLKEEENHEGDKFR